MTCIGFGERPQQAATLALTCISNNQYGKCVVVHYDTTRVAKRYENTIVFIEVDMEIKD
ncbi:conserved hypothetical protein [Ricinus communis]|uniref:Uncharacterized protein n=1 Tax=Ricinus communis TaxID=3988 RepID=B9SJS9_RICCO|nr:conserved hypothetical protein [Ricinus communis]